MPRPYSHSQLSTYENCPLQYKFCYIDKLEAEGEGIEAFMGTLVHQALFKLYDDLRVSRTNSLEDLTAHFEELWAKNWHDGIIIVREEFTPENYRDTGKRCIANYYGRHQPFERDVTVALEEWLQIPVDEDKGYVLRGIVDRISKTRDDAFEVHDYKTSHSLPPQEKLDRDRQLALYHIGVKHKWPDAKRIGLIWHYVAMDVDMASSRTEDDLRSVKGEVVKLIEQIEADDDFEPRRSALCSWCAFQDVCPLTKHGARLEHLPANEYMMDDGVQLVNKYMGALAQRKELEDRIAELEEGPLAKLEEALFLYAEKEGIKTVQGSDHALNLRTYRNYRFPSRKDDLYDDLLKAVKSTLLWEEVAMIDTFALDRIIREGGLDNRLKQKLLKFATLEEKRRIYASRSRGG